MFEVIAVDGSVLRFDDSYYFEIEGDYVNVFKEVNDFVTPITTFFRPQRVDEVINDTCLSAPSLRLAPNVMCRHCGRKQ